jgi:hypothetical protein
MDKTEVDLLRANMALWSTQCIQMNLQPVLLVAICYDATGIIVKGETFVSGLLDAKAVKILLEEMLAALPVVIPNPNAPKN